MNINFERMPFLAKKYFPTLSFIFFFTVFVYLLIRNAGVHGTVVDEWIYSRLSRLTPLKDSVIPSYFYLFIYKYTSICGDGFLECARIFNSIFFVSAAPFIYLLARQVCPKIVAGLITALSILGPINIYTSFFMPESMFFCVFWVFSWFVISHRTLTPYLYGIIAGSILGLLSLIKPHALFLAPGFILFIVTNNIHPTTLKGARRSLMIIGSFFAMVLVTKLTIGFLFAGTKGLTLFGTSYGNFAHSLLKKNAAYYFQIISLACINLKGHLMALTVLFGTPLAALVSFQDNATVDSWPTRTQSALRIYTLYIFLTLLIVVAYFAASIANSGPCESIARLHMRYYNFAFPLLLITLSSYYFSKTIKFKNYIDLWTTLLIASFSIYAFHTLPLNFTPMYIDCPELRGITYNSFIYKVLCLINFIAIITWIFDRILCIKIFLYAFMPIYLLSSSFFVNVDLRHRLIMDAYDKAGIFARNYLGKNVKDLVVVGSDPAALYRSLFHIDNPNVRMLVAKDRQIAQNEIPRDTKWLLAIGDYQLPSTINAKLSLGDFEIFRIGDNTTIDFTMGSWPGSIKNKHGLSSPEGWGTWSNGNKVILEFDFPLPKKFSVRLRAKAFGPNTAKPFAMIIGNAKNYFRLPATPQDLELFFETDGHEHTLTIEVPEPTSPKTLGVSQDDRLLGIGFLDSLTITDSAPSPHDDGIK